MTNIIKTATKQVIIEELGYDKGRMYFFLLTKENKSIEDDFSYSKKYRLFREMYKDGLIGKIKPEGKDFYKYFLLPQIFGEDEEIKEFQKRNYFKNESLIYEGGFFQIIMKMNVEDFVKFMKESGIKDGEKLDISFSKVRTKDGHEFIGHVEFKE